MCLPWLKVLVFFAFLVFFVHLRIIQSEGHEAHHKVVSTSTSTFFSFLYSYIQSIYRSIFCRFKLKCVSLLLLNITVNQELELVFFCKIKTVNLLKIWVCNNDPKVKPRAIRPSEFMGIRLLAFPK